MANIYKIKVDNQISVGCYYIGDAKKIANKLVNKGKNAKIVVFKKNVKIYDLIEEGQVQYYMEEQKENG
jgi:ribosomal protein L21